jgi:hypothetical protein
MVVEIPKTFPAFYATPKLIVVFATEPFPEPLESITGGPACDLQVGFILVISFSIDADLPALHDAAQRLRKN